LKIVLATKNEDKVFEIEKILDGLNVEILTLKDFPDCPDTIEDGQTFEENALKKAKTVFEYTGLPALADDSGLEVDALKGEPGVYSARFGGEQGNYAKNNEKLLEVLKDIPDKKRNAQFRCVAVFLNENIRETTEGVCRGKILKKLRGNNGFGYDPLFLYEPLNLTFAEISVEEKNKVSHRFKAFGNMRKIIEHLIV